MPDYDPDREYFRQLDQAFRDIPTQGIPGGSVPAWQCACYQWNGISVERCNNCGAPQPSTILARVKAAIKRQFLKCPAELELWYMDGLTEVILREVDLKYERERAA
jgi:hypothetical protein